MSSAKRVVLRAFGALALAVPAAVLAAPLIVNGDFENFPGSVPVGWSYFQGDGPSNLHSSLQSPFAPGGSSSVLMTDSAAGSFTPFLRQGFAPQTAPLSFSFDFRLDALTGNEWNVVLTGNGGSTAVIFVIDSGPSHLFKVDAFSAPASVVGSLVAQQWYRVEGIAEIGAHTLTGTLTPFGSSSVAFSNVIYSFRTNLDEFQIADTNLAGQNGGLYIDNVMIGPAVPEPGTVALFALGLLAAFGWHTRKGPKLARRRAGS
jgi:hypothetical protein